MTTSITYTPQNKEQLDFIYWTLKQWNIMLFSLQPDDRGNLTPDAYSFDGVTLRLNLAWDSQLALSVKSYIEMHCKLHNVGGLSSLSDVSPMFENNSPENKESDRIKDERKVRDVIRMTNKLRGTRQEWQEVTRRSVWNGTYKIKATKLEDREYHVCLSWGDENHGAWVIWILSHFMYRTLNDHLLEQGKFMRQSGQNEETVHLSIGQIPEVLLHESTEPHLVVNPPETMYITKPASQF